MRLVPLRAVLRAARTVVPAAVLAMAGSLAVAGPALGHGETFFQLGTDRVQPGGQVEVRADLGAGDAFQLTLIAKADGGRRDLGTIAATEEGHLQTYLTIPSDVPNGDYLVEIAWDLTVLRAPLTVAGAAIDDGGQGTRPGQDDGIGASPSPGGGEIAVAGRSAGPVASSDAASSVRGRRDALEGIGIVAVAVAVAVGLLGALRLLRRPTRPAG